MRRIKESEQDQQEAEIASDSARDLSYRKYFDQKQSLVTFQSPLMIYEFFPSRKCHSMVINTGIKYWYQILVSNIGIKVPAMQVIVSLTSGLFSSKSTSFSCPSTGISMG